MKKTALTLLSIALSVVSLNQASAELGSSCSALNEGHQCTNLLRQKGTCVKKTSLNLAGVTYECKVSTLSATPLPYICVANTSCTFGGKTGICKSMSLGKNYCDTSGSTASAANGNSQPQVQQTNIPDPNVSCLLSEASGTKRQVMSISDCNKLGGAPYAIKTNGSTGEKITPESCVGKNTPECQKLSNLTTNTAAADIDYSNPLPADLKSKSDWNAAQGKDALDQLSPAEKTALLKKYNDTHDQKNQVADFDALKAKGLNAVQVAELKRTTYDGYLDQANSHTSKTDKNGNVIEGAGAYDIQANQYNKDVSDLADLNKKIEKAPKNSNGEIIGRNGLKDTTLSDKKTALESKIKGEQDGLKMENGKALTSSDMKDKIKKADKEQAKAERRKGKDEAERDSDLEMRNHHNDNYFGGRFGGHKKEFTEQVNQGALMISEGIKVFAQSAIEAQKGQAQADLASKGQNASAQDINKARDDLKSATVKGLNTSAAIEGVNATAQAVMMSAHLLSLAKVNKKEASNKVAIDKEMKTQQAKCDGGDTNACTQIKNLQQARKNVTNNKNGENNMQLLLSAKQAMVVGKTSLQAAAFRAQAKAVNSIHVNDQTQSGMYATQLTNNNQNGVIDPSLQPVPDESAVTAVQDAGQDATAGTGDNQFNTSDPTMDQAPIPAPAQAIAQNPSAGGGSGGGLGGGGGTSPAKADEGAATASNSKEKTYGGSYGSGESASSGGGFGSRGSADNSVAVKDDNSIADMLKKLLPGGDEQKKEQAAGENTIAYGDRSPASDQAAVIGKSKDIFQEIHKRYEQKAQQGAIVF
jgi:hypothetical protein